MSEAELDLYDNADLDRYEARVDGRLAGFIDYRRAGRALILVHTEVLPEFEGLGLGAALARFALDDIRERRIPVRPDCPFIRTWMERHPEYGDLLEKP